jgi:hypothetical protein
MLDILANRKAEEPDNGYNGIDFYAHELMAENVQAIKKLLGVRSGVDCR